VEPNSDSLTPVTNREIALGRLGGNHAMFATLASFFLQDAPVLMEQLHEACRLKEFDQILHRAHSLKGLAATFEAIPFTELARQMESLARAVDLPSIVNLLPQLDVEYARLVSDLSAVADSAAP